MKKSELRKLIKETAREVLKEEKFSGVYEKGLPQEIIDGLKDYEKAFRKMKILGKSIPDKTIEDLLYQMKPYFWKMYNEKNK